MKIDVELSAAASRAWPQMPAGTAPPGAVLFIIAKSKGAVGGPPLGARRVAQPHFPLHLTLTDADSIMPQRPISSADQLELEARLSLSGTPAPSAGDWQSAVLAVSGKSAGAVKLILDQAVK
jgi:cytochrome c-type biogenesis protein CcmH